MDKPIAIGDRVMTVEEQQIEKMEDFTKGYGLTKPASVIMGTALVQSMTEHLTKEGLQAQVCQLAAANFEGIEMLTNTKHTNQFFANNFKLIKRWLKRRANKEGKTSSNVVAYASHHVPLLNNNRFPSKDLKAVLIDGNKENPYYDVIANAATKTAAIALAQNYKNFSFYWIPF